MVSGRRVVIFSTAILLANSPARAPPMPSQTAKVKSKRPTEASPSFPRRCNSRASRHKPRKESSLLARTFPLSVQQNHFNASAFFFCGERITLFFNVLVRLIGVFIRQNESARGLGGGAGWRIRNRSGKTGRPTGGK